MLIYKTHPSKRLAVVTLCLLLLSSWHFVEAQSNGSVTIKVVRIYSTHDADNESEDYRYRFWFNDDPNIPGSNCLKVNQKTHHTWIDVDYTLVSNKSIDLSSTITIDAKAWEEDGCGGDCTYDGSCGNDDGGVCDKNSGRISTYSTGISSISLPVNSTYFTLNDIPPGNRIDNLIEMWFCGGKYRVHLLVTYIPPQPSSHTILIDNKMYPDPDPLIGSFNLCGEKTIKLSTSTTILPVYNSQIQYVWEYHISGDTTVVLDPNPAYCGGTLGCGGPISIGPTKLESKEGSLFQIANVVDPGDPPPPPPCCFVPQFIERKEAKWRVIGTTSKSNDGDAISFDPRLLQGLTNLTTNESFFLRVKILANGSSSPYRVAVSQINISPPAPEIGQIFSSPSCPNSPTGKIHLSGITGLGDYFYIYKNGFDNTKPCDPEADGSCFRGNWGEDTDHIDGIQDGNYTFWLINSGTHGSCYTTKNIPIDRIPELGIQVSNLKSVSCNGGNDGDISLGKTGGIAPYNFTIGGIGTNSTGNFPSLLAGTYIVSVTDGCSLPEDPPIVRTLLVKQPTKLSESFFDPDDATCINPGNGQLSTGVLKSTGEYDTIVSTIYQYRLFKDNSLYESWESTDPMWTKGALPIGNNYQLIVTEKGSLDCNGYSKSFSIAAPDPLNISNLNTVNISCFEGSDGTITFDGTGGSNLFTFKLSKTAGDTTTNTVASFPDLNAGDYSLIIENDLPGCWDKVNYPETIKITQPESILINLAKNDITCFGYNDGNISATVTGGTPGYALTWEKFIGSSWSTVSTDGASLSGQQAGTFRLKVIDNKSCSDLSNVVSISEPDPVSINTALVKDIKCLGEKGTIDIKSGGGIQPHTYEYSLDGLSFTSFTNLTLLSSGSYTVKAIDQNGCSLTDPTQYIITSPTSALNFGSIQSDYNGFNISCYGGHNGFIDLIPTGGNGANYSGYQYSIDGGDYLANSNISDINAGTHSVSTKDGRGCIVSKDILFTQTNDLLDVQISNRQDVVCYGDLTGGIEVQGSGGLSPYLFNIDSSPSQSSTQFSSLGVGTYVIRITDLNGCTANHTENIVNLNPRIQFQSTIKDVSCFGGSDGLITINVTQGVQPFQFSWAGQTSVTNVLSNVGTGLYTVKVIDNAGCLRDSTFNIGQPNQALRTSIAAVPFCFGSTGGIITITTVGGTSPYQHSIDNGITYHNTNVFNSVGVGTYSIKVKDYNECSIDASAQIIQRNDKPEPNFLASTKQNALDTLIIKEISIPKPDSILWTFDPQAVVINDDQWSPQLKFNDAGTYTISMTGFFAGCNYTVTKNITLNPYDPNAVPSMESTVRAIESVEVSPNPNGGEFTVTLKLTKKNNLSLVVYDMIGATQYANSWQQTKDLSLRISLPQSASGIYLLRVVTDTDARDARIIINK